MGRFVVTVHTAEEPTEEEWVRYVGGAEEYRPLEQQRILVVSGGGAPNGPQRKRLIDVLNNAKVPTVILTTSWLMRGAGTAFSWFNPSLKVIGPAALPQALEYLQLTVWECAEAKRMLHDFQQKLGVHVVPLESVAQ